MPDDIAITGSPLQDTILQKTLQTNAQFTIHMMFARVSPTKKERKKEAMIVLAWNDEAGGVVWGCILTLLCVEMMYGWYE